MRHIRWIAGASFLSLLTLGVGTAALLYSPQPEAAPIISWEPSSLALDVPLGEATSEVVGFEAQADTNDVQVEVSPSISDYVQVAPTEFHVLESGNIYTLAVTVVIPGDSPLGDVDGTIHLREGKKTISRPLPLSFNVTALYQNENYSFSLAAPFKFNSIESNTKGPGLLESTELRPVDEPPSVFVDVYDNSGQLPILDWYNVQLADKEFSVPDASTRQVDAVEVSGIPSIQVESNVMGITKLRTFVPVASEVIGIAIEIPDFMDPPESYFEVVQSLELN